MSLALYIISGFSIVYFICLSVYTGRVKYSLSFMWPVLFCVCLACGLMADIAGIYIPGIVVLAAILAFLIFCLVWFVKIIMACRYEEGVVPDYLIVLGAHVNGRIISRTLERRLDTAYAASEIFPDAKVIVTGGRGTGEDVTEAFAMKEYLSGLGVRADRIITEDRSVSTYTNLEYSMEITGSSTCVGIVSNNYHIYRAVKIAEKIGFEKVVPVSAGCSPVSWLHYMIRECFAIVNYKVTGRI